MPAQGEPIGEPGATRAQVQAPELLLCFGLERLQHPLEKGLVRPGANPPDSGEAPGQVRIRQRPVVRPVSATPALRAADRLILARELRQRHAPSGYALCNCSMSRRPGANPWLTATTLRRANMAVVDVPQNAGLRALAERGYADLSPPEAEHAVLELPPNRAEYVAVLEAIGDYPARSPIGHRVLTDAEVEGLRNL